MFSVEQKREIANRVQMILRKTGHPELPEGEIQFSLHVDGAESWSWADIKNNGAVTEPGVNPWNEAQAEKSAPSSKHEAIKCDTRNKSYTNDDSNLVIQKRDDGKTVCVHCAIEEEGAEGYFVPATLPTPPTMD